MARAPAEGRCKTRLAAAVGELRAVELYQAMLLDSLARYERAGAARNVVLAAPEDDGLAALRALVPSHWEVLPQTGQGLGERLANGFRALMPGATTVVLMDSDSPTLPMEPLAAALRDVPGA